MDTDQSNHKNVGLVKQFVVPGREGDDQHGWTKLKAASCHFPRAIHCQGTMNHDSQAMDMIPVDWDTLVSHAGTCGVGMGGRFHKKPR